MLEWNVQGDAGNEIVGVYENRSDACTYLADSVKGDMQNLGWFDQCDYTEALDEDNNKVKNGQPLPDKLSYFLIQQDGDFRGEYYEMYCVVEKDIVPSSEKISDRKVKPDNRIPVPILTDTYDAVCKYVKEHSGEKGFYYTGSDDCDYIWAMIYEGFDDPVYSEYRIYALKVNEFGALVCYCDPPNIKCDAEYIKSIVDDESQWIQVRYDDYLYFTPTIFNIAENIQEYEHDQ